MNPSLTNYLADEIKKIDEFEQICKVEDPEFDRLNQLAKDVLGESFIDSASEYGITRLENIAGIVPNVDDTLSNRKFRLNVRYQFKLPYTLITLIERLNSICGKGMYTLNIINNKYDVVIDTKLTTSSQYDELIFLLEQVIPANMLIVSNNTLRDEFELGVFYGSAFTEYKSYTIK